MGKKYENEFKVMIVELINSGQSVKTISEEYNLHDSMLRRWRREFKAKLGDFSKKKVLSAEALENKRLQKELKDVQMERDILKKAVSIFSKSDK